MNRVEQEARPAEGARPSAPAPGPAVPSLCQRAGASCGACCGLYNRADLGREPVVADLRANTALLGETARTPEAFGAAAAARARQLPAPVFPSIRICPLLGYLDEAEERVGCLAHPLLTGGVDLRACGVYDVLTCDAFLCPSHAYLSEEDAALVAAAGDFYLYGLVVTDAPFVRAVLEALAERAGVAPSVAALGHPPFAAALRELFALKEELAPGSEGVFGAFRAKDSRAVGGAGPRAERILQALGADAASGNDEDALLPEVERRLARCAAALVGAAR